MVKARDGNGIYFTFTVFTRMISHFPSPRFAGVHLKKAAIIEMSFSKASFANAVTFYQNLFGIAPTAQPSPYPFKVTDTIGMMLVDSATTAGNQTTIYWQLEDGAGKATIDSAYQALINNYGCKSVTKPYQLTLTEGDDIWLATLRDPGGDVFGIIINPPVPFTRIAEREEPMVAPTHIINPPVTADGSNDMSGAGYGS